MENLKPKVVQIRDRERKGKKEGDRHSGGEVGKTEGERSKSIEQSLPNRIWNILDIKILMSCLMVNFDCQIHGV